MRTSPRRLAPGANTKRWRVVDCFKISLIVIAVLVFGWNISTLSMMMHNTSTQAVSSIANSKSSSPQTLREPTRHPIRLESTLKPQSTNSPTSTLHTTPSVIHHQPIQPNAKATTTKATIPPPIPPSTHTVQQEAKPWFLDPQWYKEKSGCDFSAVVSRFKPKELEINCENIDQLQLDEYLGEGFWRQVYTAQWKGRTVAVKVVKEKLLTREDIIPRHVEEAAALFPLRHEPNIVPLLGWCNTTVVVGFVDSKLEEWVFESPETPLSVERALELARDAARGVAQLHSVEGGPFAHTDIQTRQFLLDHNGRLLLNDFNRIKYTGPCQAPGQTNLRCKSSVSVAKGKWRAPEEYLKQRIDEKVDIYSLSLVLWTLRAREKPFEALERAEVYQQVPLGLRPSIEAMSDYPTAMQQLIIRAWDHNPELRPTAVEMAQEIDRISTAYKAGQIG